MTATPDRPDEHCGHQPDTTIGQPTECVLRPGHSGSHANETGMRWWKRQPENDHCGRSQNHPGHRFMRGRKVYQCPGATAAQAPDRPGLDQLTSDQLDRLYAELDELLLIVRMKDGMHRSAEGDVATLHARAERAEATLTAVRKLAQQWQSGMRPGESHPAARAVLDLLDQHGRTPKETT